MATRRTGQIIKRGDNKHLVRIFIGTNEATGKRIYHNHTIRGIKKDAEKVAEKVKEDFKEAKEFVKEKVEGSGEKKPDADHSCAGKNTCKGKGGCKTGDNGCAGKNTCKGKGGCAIKDGKPVPAK